MANIRATKNGNWSDNTVWTPNPPTSVDNVFPVGFTVYVDQNITVNSISTLGTTGIGGGGTFRPNNGVIMTTNVVAGSTTCVTFGSASPNAFTLVGNVSGGNAANAFGIQNTAAGLINVIGNVAGGTSTAAHGIRNDSTGTVNITGSILGGNAPSFAGVYGVLNSTSGIINILGNISHAPNAGIYTVVNNSTGTINITGSVLLQPLSTAGTNFTIAVYNGSTGAINIYGNVSGGNSTNSYGTYNAGAGNITIYGNVSAGYGLTVSSGSAGSYNNSTGTINIIGNIYGSQNTSTPGVINASTGTIAVTGNVYAFDAAKADLRAGIGGSGSSGIANSGAVTIVGNVYGGSRSDAWGIVNNGSGPVIVFGNAYGGYLTDTDAIRIPTGSNGTVTLSGTAYGGLGPTAYGLRNLTTGTGIARVKRAAGNNWGLGYTTALGASPGVFGSQTGSTFVEELECGPRGQWPTAGNVYFTPNTKATSQFETDTFANYTLIESNSADNLIPPASSVRQGISYNLGLNTGTCILPPTSSVALNVLVDNLTGTAVLTPQTTWNYSVTASSINSMGGRLDNALNTQAAGILINSFNP